MKGKLSPHVLVAIDGSEYSRKAFQYACSFARNYQIPLVILNVVEEYVDVGYSISKQLERTSKEILHKYEARAKSLGLKSVKTIQARGYPADEILKVADKENIGTIIIGSRGNYDSSENFLLGSTSYKIAHYSKRTVIIVK
jgi:nucleotide-binding universal stress UspA family protein